MIINGNTLDEFSRDFRNVVESLQEKYDVTISLGPVTYWENGFSSKMTVYNGRDLAEIERREFDENVWKYAHLGLERGMYRRVFIGATGEKYALLGFNTKAKKYPLEILKISDGSRGRAGERFIKELLNEYYVENTLFQEDLLKKEDDR